jgi:hypothetical protein
MATNGGTDPIPQDVWEIFTPHIKHRVVDTVESIMKSDNISSKDDKILWVRAFMRRLIPLSQVAQYVV